MDQNIPPGTTPFCRRMVKVRSAEKPDAPAIAALVTLAYRVEEFFVDGDRTDASDVLQCLDRGEFLLLEDGECLAGCVFVERRGGRGYFGMLSIDPSRQRKGLGARLVSEAEAWCLRHGCRIIEIEVVNIRSELPPFYRKLGYVEEGSRPFPDVERCKLPCHFIVMTKRLDART